LQQREQQNEAKTYERNATLLLQKAQRGEIEFPDVERLAREVLALGEQAEERAKTTGEQVTN